MHAAARKIPPALSPINQSTWTNAIHKLSAILKHFIGQPNLQSNKPLQTVQSAVNNLEATFDWFDPQNLQSLLGIGPSTKTQALLSSSGIMQEKLLILSICLPASIVQ